MLHVCRGVTEDVDASSKNWNIKSELEFGVH